MFAPWLMPVIAARNCFRRAGIGVERLEETRPAALDLVLRLARPERLGQVAPERIEPLVRHLEDAADVRRLVAIEEEIGLGRVARSGRRRAFRNPSATSASRKSRAERGAGRGVRVSGSKRSAPRASSVKTPISIALSSVFDGQNASPVCRIFSGVACVTVSPYLVAMSTVSGPWSGCCVTWLNPASVSMSLSSRKV